MYKNCNSKLNQNLNTIRIRKLAEQEINHDEFKMSIQNIQLKKEKLKIGSFEFIIHKPNLKRKTACSIQPNKVYLIYDIYSHPDLRIFEEE